MGKVKKIQECKKIKVRRQLFVKPIAIVKPYVPENKYKAPQIYVPQVVETRPLEESDEETYEDQLEIYDDLPEIDDGFKLKLKRRTTNNTNDDALITSYTTKSICLIVLTFHKRFCKPVLKADINEQWQKQACIGQTMNAPLSEALTFPLQEINDLLKINPIARF
ncbi:uncharacterized protein LOC105847800 [Hydra vulgaris]|uniref:uncharacterized protein LOC105847800 n=1 Tax=Hydra vulgaris TaxID=6087 RepID=UPI001F5FCE2A|nr:uncharacterized protein LOC105847800 [Hydra vulgaris]